MRIPVTIISLTAIGAIALSPANAGDKDKLIHSAMSAAPAVVTADATIKDGEGKVLREGSSDWTCFPQQPAIGPMCNNGEWGALMAAMMAQEDFSPTQFSVSYMLAGEGDAIGVSNIDPYAAEPSDDNDWVKEGPHMMIIVPDAAMLEGMSTDPNDPVYVMWKDTPYAHIMVKIADDESEKE